MAKTIAISLVGPGEIAREGLRRILAEERLVVASAGGDAASIRLDAIAGEGIAHIIVIDDTLTRDGNDIYGSLRLRFPRAQIVVLGDVFDPGEAARAFRAGAAAYLIRDMPPETLLLSLRMVALGEKVLPWRLAGSLFEGDRGQSGDWPANAALVNLSAREIAVLGGLVLGRSNKLISQRLGISEATVKVHVKSVLRKLRVENRTQAAIWAVTRGLEPRPDDKDGGQNGTEPGMSIRRLRIAGHA